MKIAKEKKRKFICQCVKGERHPKAISYWVDPVCDKEKDRPRWPVFQEVLYLTRPLISIYTPDGDAGLLLVLGGPSIPHLEKWSNSKAARPASST